MRDISLRGIRGSMNKFFIDVGDDKIRTMTKQTIMDLISEKEAYNFVFWTLDCFSSKMAFILMWEIVSLSVSTPGILFYIYTLSHINPLVLMLMV